MSLSAAVLRKMQEKGLSIEDAIEIAEVWEAGVSAPLPELDVVAERRRAYDRQRKRKVKAEIPPENSTGIPPEKVSPTPPSKIPLSPPKGGTFPTEIAAPRPEKPLAEPEGFEEWWAAYPNKKAKGAGRVAYRAALKKTQSSVLLAAVIRYPFTDDRKFIPHPATWLNGECWLDLEPERPPPAADADPWPRRLLGFERSGYWNSEWGPRPDKPGCHAPMEKAA